MKLRKAMKTEIVEKDGASLAGDRGVDLEGIDRFLREGPDSISSQGSTIGGLEAEIVVPLEEKPEAVPSVEIDVGGVSTERGRKAEFDPGLSTLVFREGFGEMEVRVSPDKMSASLVSFNPRRQDILLEEVIGALKANRIVFGIEERAIKTVLKAASKRGGVTPNIIIARGTPVVEGMDARFFLAFLQDKPESGDSPRELTEDVISDMERVGKAFRNGNESLKHEDLRGFLVKSGECILRKHTREVGTKGKSIFGVVHPPKQGKDVNLKAGPNVREKARILPILHARAELTLAN